MDLIDISRPLSSATAVWPGDQPVEWSWTAQIQEGSTVNLGAIHFSTHAGSHADAPRHARENGDTTDHFDLSAFIGPVEVVNVEEEVILPLHVEEVTTSRVLFRTSASELSVDEWPDSITSLHPDTVSVLAESDTVLIGTDAPSVDPLDSSSLPAHHALIDAEIINLEGLSLGHVAPGRYRLMALPLKIQSADAAPVRAVLVHDESG